MFKQIVADPSGKAVVLFALALPVLGVTVGFGVQSIMSSFKARSFAGDIRGNVAVIFGLALPVLLGGVAVAVDSAQLYGMQAAIQSIADSSSLAAAKELKVFGSTSATIEAAAMQRVEALLADARLADEPHSVAVEVDKLTGTARVNITLVARTVLPVSVNAENPIKVQAEARAFGKVPVCVIALSPTGSAALRSKDIGVVAAPDCAVQSNSTDPAGLIVETGGTIVSKQTCSSGGVVGPLTSFLPTPAKTDCPAMPDPLSSRAAPEVVACNYTKREIKGGTATILPGVYCGGLTISNRAVVTASPGIYIIKGGKLSVAQDATLRGTGVSFYFADDDSVFEFKDRSVIELSAPVDGAMAGLLIFEARTAKLGRAFAIGSGNVRKLLGTIYLPRGLLDIDAKGNIAAQSAYTVIIARTINLKAANLVLNADYSATSVPLPAGLGGEEENIALER